MGQSSSFRSLRFFGWNLVRGVAALVDLGDEPGSKCDGSQRIQLAQVPSQIHANDASPFPFPVRALPDRGSVRGFDAWILFTWPAKSCPEFGNSFRAFVCAILANGPALPSGPTAAAGVAHPCEGALFFMSRRRLLFALGPFLRRVARFAGGYGFIVPNYSAASRFRVDLLARQDRPIGASLDAEPFQLDHCRPRYRSSALERSVSMSSRVEIECTIAVDV